MALPRRNAPADPPAARQWQEYFGIKRDHTGAKRAIELEKEYKRLKAALKKCDKKPSHQKKTKCKKTLRKRLKGHDFLEVKSLYSW